MQKQILFMCTVFCTTITAMEEFIPHIVYHENSANSSLIEQLSQNFSSLKVRGKDGTPDNTSAIVHATRCLMLPSRNPKCKLNYMISLAEGNSFIGLDKHKNNNINAPIPMAAAHVLEEKIAQRILIIDENITQKTAEHYFKHGNGSIFFPENNPELAALFSNKIVAHNQISEELWDFLPNQKNKIDLAFYNINIDDVEPIENLDPADAKDRKSRIISLLYNFIPTIFIFSGDKEKYQINLCDHLNYINKQAEKCVAFKNEPFPKSFPIPHPHPRMVKFNQEWEQCKDNFMHAARDLMSSLKKHPAAIAITNNYQPIPTQSPSSSQSLSSSLSDLEQERNRLKHRLNMQTSPSDSESNEEEFFDDYSDEY